jgi:hypothetical protein
MRNRAANVYIPAPDQSTDRTWTARSLRIATPDGTPVHLAVDGEVTDAEPRLRIFKREKRLLVYRPDRE